MVGPPEDAPTPHPVELPDSGMNCPRPIRHLPVASLPGPILLPWAA